MTIGPRSWWDDVPKAEYTPTKMTTKGFRKKMAIRRNMRRQKGKKT